MIRAIGTRYAGCFFRSRLEARWAVFFDVLDLRWEYEAEGYHLPSAPYLPDFHLPEARCFVEVKADVASREQTLKVYELAREVEADGWQVLLVEGNIPREASGLPEEFFELLRLPFSGHAGQRNRAVQAALDCARSARFEHGEVPQLTDAREIVRNCEDEVADIIADADWQNGWCIPCGGTHNGCPAEEEDLAEMEAEYREAFRFEELPEAPTDRLEFLSLDHYENRHDDCNHCPTCGCDGARCSFSVSSLRD